MLRRNYFFGLCLFALSACSIKKPLFELVKSDNSGVHFNNEIIENDSLNVLDISNIYNGGGVGVGDFNKDGLSDIYLEQFYAFGSMERYKPEVMETIMKANSLSLDGYSWLLDRFISVAYYALINYEDVVPTPDALSDSCEWYALDELPNLMLDHSIIVTKALQTLRDNLERKLVGINLLPTLFTMKELQQVYEAILGEKLHRGTFQRKVLSMGILKRHEKHFSGAANKAPFLYSFEGSLC
jgi:hypothetical protein